MTIPVDWTFLIQSRLKRSVGSWFEKHEVETYEEAVKLLQKNDLPVGSREEVAKHLPVRPEINDLLFDSGSTTTSVAGRLTKKKVDKGPKSAAEEAADAITASSAAKTVASKKPTKKRQTTRKRTTKSSKSSTTTATKSKVKNEQD
tara:strand:+ start:1662 stop:2099 length:438 start_codon:yes stop_codon:yes gene_type:complete